jgi:dipeptidyl aminopeptidase/acylaminoacyl peptidase
MRALLLVGIVLTLVGCAQPGAVPEPMFAPNANLVLQGIPPIPQTLVDRVKLYTDFRGHGFADWHPKKREMLVVHRKAGDATPQIYRLAGPMAELEQLTAEAEPVTVATYEPREGRTLVYARASGGNEAAQLYRMDLETRQSTQFTDPDQRHALVGWLNVSPGLIYSSVPLDRTAQGGKRASIDTTLTLVDPLRPAGARQLAALPGGGWTDGVVSADDRFLALGNYRSANESQVWLIDLASGERRQVLPAPGEALKAAHFVAGFKTDGSGLFFLSNRAGEFMELMSLDFKSGNIQRMSAHIPWDLSGASLSDDGQRIVVQANVDGRDELRLFDARTGQELQLSGLPPGSVGTSSFHHRLAEVAFTVNSSQSPSQVFTLDVNTGRVQPWTRAYAPPGIEMDRFGGQEIVRWTSFDGRTISGLLNRPPARFAGKRPVVIDIHGGPEGQAQLGFMGRDNYLINELGLAIISPNVRGSSGFGKTFLTLDDGVKREDSVKDVGALLEWIATQPDLDASRVLVMGGSYGGYMSLAVSTHYADRIAGSIDEVGISNFVTFLQNTESYRRDLRRVEYGDERDPLMREFLERISPLKNAKKINKPLFVIQGKNDPRVPFTEAEQIVAEVRANGTPVWYLRAENEGHGFARKENADFRFYAIVRFIESVLLKP